MPPTPASIRAFPIPRPSSFRGILFFFFLSLLVSPTTISTPLVRAIAIALHIATSTSSVSVALAFAAAAPLTLVPISTALFGTTMAFTSIFAIAAAAT